MLHRSLAIVRQLLMQPKFTRTACRVLLVAGFLSFLISLDRYPQSFIDESFFSYPAVSFLHGTGFRGNVSSMAPHADLVWAYHAPFFPRMRVATFAALGISEFSSRLPQYLSAYLAAALLCEFLIVRGLSTAALILAIAWIGDRSSQEVLYGRMEGIVLLWLAVGFVSLVRTLERPTWPRGALCGMSLGAAAGFHPVAAIFGVAAAVLLAARLRGRPRLLALAAFVAGGLVPLSLVLWAWSPDIPASIEQFRWFLGQVSTTPLLDKLAHVFTMLRWSRYWPLALAGAVVLALIPAAIMRLSARRTALPAQPHEPLWLAACAFAVAGLACLLSRAVFPYYLVYFTIWPVIAFTLTPAAGPRARAFRVWFWAVAAAAALSWIPSLLWNGLRLRESLLYRRQLDHAHFIGQLRQAIPTGAQVAGQPLFLLIAQEAGLAFTPLPWLAEHAAPDPAAWLLLSAEERRQPKWVAPASLEGRPVITEADAFPGSGPFHLDYVILGPKARGTQP